MNESEGGTDGKEASGRVGTKEARASGQGDRSEMDRTAAGYTTNQ